MMVKWGIIGCGNVTEVKSGPAFKRLPHSMLSAVMRRDAVLAQEYAARHGVAQWYDLADDLIHDPEVTAVYVATPPAAHCELVLKALRAGKPVYVEKPMGLTYAECTLMIRTAQEVGVPLFVAFYRRMMPYFKRVKEVVMSGRIGRVVQVSSRIVRAPSANDRAGRGWHTTKSLSGGGHFVDLAPHQIDLLVFLFGLPLEQRSFARNVGGLYQVEDYVELNLSFAHGVSYQGVWFFGGAEAAHEDSFVIIGTEGTLRFSTFDMTDIRITTSSEEVIVIEKEPTVQRSLINHIVDELNRGITDIPSATYEAAQVTSIIESALAEYDKQMGELGERSSL